MVREIFALCLEHPARRRSGVLLACLAVFIPTTIPLGACSSGAGPKSATIVTSEEGQELFRDAGASAREEGKWTIVLAAFRGDDAAQAAEFARSRVATEGGLTDLQLEQRGEAILLTTGRFDGPQDPQAAAQLARVRSLEIQGVKPFDQALLTPPEPAAGSTPQYDLRNVGAAYAYTLQIGSYGRDDGRTPTPEDQQAARRAAEQAVAVLRSEGEQAFYFHGPNFSSVTVGLFRENEVDPQTGLRSPAFYELQAKFPFNLFNGAQRTVRLEGSRQPQPQRSVLVRIPRTSR